MPPISRGLAPPSDLLSPVPPRDGVGVSVRIDALAYGKRSLFESFDLRLEPGEWTCLLGPSGVGKTTLLRTIANLTPKGTDHRVEADDGRPLSGRIALMAQQDLLMPWLSVLDNIAIGYRLRREPFDRNAALVLLEQVGLKDMAERFPASLSGGQRQRVALVRTLLENRPLILMDEPFSSLDPATRHTLQTHSAQLLRGKTVFLVTHDPLEALRLGHRVLVLSGCPAQLTPLTKLHGTPLRDIADPEVQRLHARLLALLAGGDPPPTELAETDRPTELAETDTPTELAKIDRPTETA